MAVMILQTTLADGGEPMIRTQFRAMAARKTADHRFARIRTRAVFDLPNGDVLIKVHSFSLNNPNALSASGNEYV